jgi:hypothetical protein
MLRRVRSKACRAYIESQEAASMNLSNDHEAHEGHEDFTILHDLHVLHGSTIKRIHTYLWAMRNISYGFNCSVWEERRYTDSMIIQANTRKKEFRAFNTIKVKSFKPLDNPQAWLALLKLSRTLAASTSA